MLLKSTFSTKMQIRNPDKYLINCSPKKYDVKCIKIFLFFKGGLESLKNLQRLLLNNNHLISTKGLSDAPTLVYIDCSFNHLTDVEGIQKCGLLQILKLQGNNLSEVKKKGGEGMLWVILYCRYFQCNWFNG